MSEEIVKEYDAFISYKSEDLREALYIAESLSAKRIKCWFDKTDIRIGEDYEKEIAESMPLCRSLVLLLSDESQKSEEVKKEFEAAVKNHLPIFPIRIYENVKLNDYYTEELKHIQIANDYWKDAENKIYTLANIRNKIFVLRNETPKTDKELFAEEVNNYKTRLNQINDYMSYEFENVIIKSIERCGFTTPEPQYMEKVLDEYISDYKLEIDLLIQGIMHENDLHYLYDFCDYVAHNNPVVNMWIDYKNFVEIVHKGLSYLDGDYCENAESFKLRMYKDYLYILKKDMFKHPIVRLLDLLNKDKNVNYDKVISYLKDRYQPSFVEEQCLAVYLDLLYFGNDYINNGSIVKINSNNEVFSPNEIIKATDGDFVLKYLCDQLISKVIASGNKGLINKYLSDNTIVNLNGHINALYFYMIYSFSQSGYHDIVKMILRYMGSFNLIEFISDDSVDVKGRNDYKAIYLAKDRHVKKEIAKMKKLFVLSMLNSGYELADANKLWKEA